MSVIPNFKTLLDSNSSVIQQVCLAHQNNIEEWFKHKWQNHTPPLYGSVDLRNSGNKLTPVDMNLFPGGFNNIDETSINLAIDTFKTLFTQKHPKLDKILLIPENHTRNIAYLKNVYALYNIIAKAGFEVKIGLLLPELSEITNITLDNGINMIYHPLKQVNNSIQTIDGFIPDIVLVNNDLSTGRPQILENINQVLLPPLNAGWYMRKKTNFFSVYDKVAEEFANLVGIDSWLINAFFSHCQNLDFSNHTGLEELATHVDTILNKTKLKYQEHNIKETPYVIVKANSGTYGMGIMAVHSKEQILSMNRKTRNKMAVIKDGQHVNDVIIQEGVHTIEDFNGQIAEPVIYMANDQTIGAFYRIHPDKKRDENLNASGAHFSPMVRLNNNVTTNNNFYAYDVIARLSLLAGSIELETYI